MTKDLFLAILSMDSYNRPYNAGIAELSDELGTQIGTATISARSDSSPISAEVAAGFYAVSDEWNGESAGVRPGSRATFVPAKVAKTMCAEHVQQLEGGKSL